MILYILLTHRPASEVAAYLEDFGRVLPGRDIVVCYGGTRDDFDDMAGWPNALFVDDPELRRRSHPSFTSVLGLVHQRFVEPNPAYTCVHVMEYDHLVLSPQYETELLAIMSDGHVGLLAQNCADHTMANWLHAIALLDDHELEARLREISVRDQDVLSIWGGLGNGMTVGRKALQEFCRRASDLPRYMEAYVPTVIYHLGYRLVDAAKAATLFDHVRYGPPYGPEEATRLARDGALALHPVKERVLQQEVVAIADAQRAQSYDRDNAPPQSA